MKPDTYSYMFSNKKQANYKVKLPGKNNEY